MSDNPNPGDYHPIVLQMRLEEYGRALEAEKQERQALEKEFKDFKKAMADRERANLFWGLGVLGSVVMALGGVLWSYRSVIFR